MDWGAPTSDRATLVHGWSARTAGSSPRGLMPRAPRQCSRSGCLHHVPCPEHTPPPWQGAGKGRARAERALAMRVVAEEPHCRDCGAPSTQAGHVVAKAYGGRYERGNLKGQCGPCNVRQIHADRLRHVDGHRP